MVTASDFHPSRPGTRFKLFPQPPFGTPIEAETVWVSSPVGSVGPGPSDERMFVIEPAAEKRPYGISYGPRGFPSVYLPPWDGPAVPPVSPDEEGHFDYLEPGMPEFEAAHVFGCARFVLDVWEDYFGRRIPWHFEPNLDRLEIALLPRYGNAQAGFGFLELGSYLLEKDEEAPFTLNFDIIAHEIGHLIIASEVGLPTAETAEGEYFGFHEAAADLVALVASAHFDSVIDQLLDQTAGNLYVLNRLNRIGELSDNKEIRTASNGLHLSAFAEGWIDEHDLSLPLTGAIFDILVDIFHELLVERRLISPKMEHLADLIERQPEHEGLIQSLFDATFSQDPGGFKEALVDARDWIGSYLAQALIRLSPHHLNYDDVAAVLLETDRMWSGGRFQRLIARNFDLRGIGSVKVGPRLKPPGAESHAFSARSLVPAAAARLPRLSYRERMAIARAGARPSP